MLLRYQMLPMTLDIEHFAKVRLLERIEKAGEDGYDIVRNFLALYDETNSKGELVNSAKSEIRRGSSSPYVAGILAKYPDFDFPAWVFLELTSFGSFIYFYKFCANKFEDKKMADDFYLLQSVKSLRNACAHNNCILNEMSAGKPMFHARNAVSRAVGGIRTIGKGQRKSKLSNDRLQQVATTLYVHSILASDGVHQHRSESLHVFVSRMNKHIEYYEGNDQISSGFEFIEKLVDAWFSPDAMVADLEKKRHLILGALKSNVDRQRKTVSVLQRGVFERGNPLVFNMSRTLSQVKHHFLLWKQVVTTRHLGQTGKARVTMVR